MAKEKGRSSRIFKDIQEFFSPSKKAARKSGNSAPPDDGVHQTGTEGEKSNDPALIRKKDPVTAVTGLTTKVSGYNQRAREVLERTRDALKADLDENSRKKDGGIVMVNHDVYLFIEKLYVILHIVISILAMLFLKSRADIGIPINIQTVVMVMQAVHLVLSFKTVTISDCAGISFLGEPLHKPKTGFCLVPFGLFSLIKTSRNDRDIMIPKGGASIKLVTGVAQFKEKEVESDTDPLNRRMSIEAKCSIRYKPMDRDDTIFRIIRSLSLTASSEEIDKKIEDLLTEQATQDLRSIVSMVTFAVLNENAELINEIFYLKVSLASAHLGIELDPKGCGVFEAIPNELTRIALDGVVSAQLEKYSLITKAEGEGTAETLKNKGKASLTREEYQSQADGLKLVKDAVGEDGLKLILVANMAEKSLKNTDKVFFGENPLGQFIGTIQALLGRPPDLTGKVELGNADAAEEKAA